MARRKHPLELYQRGRRFGDVSNQNPGDAERESRDSKPKQRRARPARPGSRGRKLPSLGIQRTLRRGREKLSRLPVKYAAAGAVAGVLLLAVGAYAVGFWPAWETGTSEDPLALRNEWRDPVGAAAVEPLWSIQIASARIPGLGFQGHDEAQAFWIEQEQSAQAFLDQKLAEELPGFRVGVEAVYNDETMQDDVRLLVGRFTSRQDPELLEFHRWLQDNGFEDAIIVSR